MTTGSIAEPTHIWWDVRPSEKFPTLEIRIPDMCTRVEETLCIVALIQAITAKLVQLRQANQSWRLYPKALIDENKWRALRYGVEGKLIDFGKKKEIPFPELIGEILAWVDDVLDNLKSRNEVEYVYTILKNGTSADRQLEVYRQTDDLRAVVDHVVEETQESIT
jgi:carboxylate-amine ligase